jgi:putative heme-binding domain-containing protein
LPAKLFDGLLAQATVEKDPEVLSQFAATARRLDAPQAMRLVTAVLNHDEVSKDPYIPLLCWWVFEAHIPSANNEVLATFNTRTLWDEPMVFDHLLPRLARRYTVDGKRAELLLCAQLFRMAPSAKHAAQLMKGFEQGFRGRPMTGLPDELVAAILKSGQAPLVFRVKQGDAAAVSDALKIIEDAKASGEERLLLTRSFGEVHEPRAVPVLLNVASSNAPNSLRKAALAALSTYDHAVIGTKTVELLPKFSTELQTAAFALLASRPSWSTLLLDAIQGGKVKRASVPDDVANRLRGSKETKVSELASRLLPKPEPVAAEYQQRIDAIHGILKRAPGNPYAGEAAYMQRCASCHKLFFKGGNVGPDLTSYQRDNLSTMLLSIVNPSVEVREGYQYYNVETKDGRSLSGFFVDRDNQVTVLRGLDGENMALRSSEISELQPMGRSLMPDGLLEGMTEQELRDLFAYLRISQPITN